MGSGSGSFWYVELGNLSPVGYMLRVTQGLDGVDQPGKAMKTQPHQLRVLALNPRSLLPGAGWWSWRGGALSVPLTSFSLWPRLSIRSTILVLLQCSLPTHPACVSELTSGVWVEGERAHQRSHNRWVEWRSPCPSQEGHWSLSLVMVATASEISVAPRGRAISMPNSSPGPHVMNT